jgi:plasmid stabilization system protein ParE
VIVTLRPEAEADIEDAARWYEHRSSGLGGEFLDVIRPALQTLGREPDLYPRIHADIRRCVVRRFPFAVFYTRDDDGIVGFAAMHMRRDPGRWQERL